MTKEEWENIKKMISSIDSESYKLGFDLLWNDDDFMQYIKEHKADSYKFIGKYELAINHFLNREYPLYNAFIGFYYLSFQSELESPSRLLLNCFVNEYFISKGI